MTDLTSSPTGGAPAPSPIPVVDISATGPSATPVQMTMELAREHGPLFTRRLHGRDATFVSSLDLVTELADERRFAKAVGPALENVREFAGDGLFTAYNDEPNWARAHDILMPAFALGSLRAYHPVMLRVARRLLASWDARAGAGTPVDVADDMTRMTLDTIGLAGFDFDFGSFTRETPHPFVEAMVRCLEWSMRRLGRAPGGDHRAQDEAFRADADYLASVVDEVVRARTAGGEDPGDLLSLMLTAGHPADGTPLDTANIRNQVITFLIAGHETTSGALSFALYHLLKDPAALRLVQHEADALFGDAENPEPTFEDVAKLRYTRQVLHEALRLWPTAAAFGRQAREDTVLGGRYPVAAGQIVTVLTPMLHRDEVWGDNPELFDPQRFAPEAEEARPSDAYKPFGTGERACIGRQFALHEATMLLGMLAHRYRLIDHADYRLRIKETLTLKPDGFTLLPRRRTAEDRATAHRALAVLPGAAPAAEDAASREAEGLPTRVRRGTGLLVLHGSNYGTCRDLADRLADTTSGLGCTVETAPLDAYAGELPTTRPVVIVAASYNGHPTDDAAAFAKWLQDAEDGATEGVPFAVLGVGDRNWAATYQRVPTLLDDRLAALGGERLLPRAEADASGAMEAAVASFTAGLRTALLSRHGDPDSVGASAAEDQPAYTVREVVGGPLRALTATHDLLPMTVTEAHDLTAPGHHRPKRFLRVALPEGTTYRTADHLTVLPSQPAATVDRALAALGVAGETVLSIHPSRPGRDRLPLDRPVSVRDLLTHHLELTGRAGAAQIALLADHHPCPPEAAALRTTPPDGRTVLELLEAHPALRSALPWPAILDLLPPLRPRHYSISSSPATDPRHADLMVSLLPGGTASAHLHTLAPGDTLPARVQPCREAFRIDPRAAEPVIMVAAGTGLAPFRGAVADRVACRATTPALLYFGCDAPDTDLLHARELREAETRGALSLRPVFSSRPEHGHRYVQHRVAAEADELGALLEAGARVYVCGDGAHMAPGVREAFRAVHAAHTGAGEQECADWLDELIASGRYVEDVYVPN